MKERPIIFGAASVRAILAGTKTQTRRVIPDDWWRCIDPEDDDDRANAPSMCPYGVTPDRLWAREAWRSWEERCDDGTGAVHDFDQRCGPHCAQVYVAYRATPREGYRPRPDKATITYLDASTPLESNPALLGPWRSPIHMPRWASRITLEITDVRVQRLQEISGDDIAAEMGWLPCDRGPSCSCAPDMFRPIWDRINGKRAPWDSNPWVWAITFRRLTEETPR